MKIWSCVFLLLFAFPAGRQLVVVDLPQDPHRPIDEELKGRGAAYSSPPVASGEPISLPWKITISPSSSSQSKQGLLVQIQNTSNDNRRLPLNADGPVVAKACLSDGIYELSVDFTDVSHHTSNYKLYGCDALKGSLVSVGPQDWIMIREIGQERDGEQLQAVRLSISRNTFEKRLDGWFVTHHDWITLTMDK